MNYRLVFTQRAEKDLQELARNRGLAKRLKAVQKTLGMLETNLRHPGLQTHKFRSLKGPQGQEVFEAYAEQHTPATFRIFWCYGPQPSELTIIAITEHP